MPCRQTLIAAVAALSLAPLAPPASGQTLPGNPPAAVPAEPAAPPASPLAAVSLDAARIAHLSGLAAVAGRPLDAAQLRGHAVLVSFFASWCPPCTAEFEHMKLLQLAHAAEGLTVVAVNLFEDFGGFADDGKRLATFLGRHQPVFSVVRGTDETAKLFGGVARIPTVLVFDRAGGPVMTFVHKEGARKTNPGMDELTGAVRNALGISAAGSWSLPGSGSGIPHSPVIPAKAGISGLWARRDGRSRLSPG